MLTIFSTPKAFRGHFAVIQCNAIQSWLKLRPACEVILFGNEEGTAETVARLGVRHIPRVEYNEWGTPLISSLFGEAQKIASNPILCYVNADIILMSDFLRALQRVRKRVFLLVGRRWNLEVKDMVNFDDRNWAAGLCRAVAERGVLDRPEGLDYFVFPKGILNDIPPLSVGRPGWDNWMIYKARLLSIPVIDITPSVTVVHQIHDYSHLPQGMESFWKGPEAEANFKLIDGGNYSFTLWDATGILMPGGLRPAINRVYIKRRLDTQSVIFPKKRFRAIILRLVFLLAIRFYDWLAGYGGGRAALAVFRKLFKFATNLMESH